MFTKIALFFIIVMAILFAPLPYNQKPVVCPVCIQEEQEAPCPPCPKAGWHLGKSLYQKYMDALVSPADTSTLNVQSK
jgi:hypothetical protein